MNCFSRTNDFFVHSLIPPRVEIRRIIPPVNLSILGCFSSSLLLPVRRQVDSQCICTNESYMFSANICSESTLAVTWYMISVLWVSRMCEWVTCVSGHSSGWSLQWCSVPEGWTTLKRKSHKFIELFRASMNEIARHCSSGISSVWPLPCAVYLKG